MQAIESFLSTWNERESAHVQAPQISNEAKIYNNVYATLSKSARNAYTVRINYIESETRRKGKLKNFLQWIAAQADSGGFDLSMVVQPVSRHYEESPSKEKLKEVAERYGFYVLYEYPDGLGYEMVRQSED